MKTTLNSENQHHPRFPLIMCFLTSGVNHGPGGRRCEFPPGLAAREPGALDASCDFSRSRVPIPEMEDVGLVDDMTINRHGVCGALLHARHPHGAVQVS